MENNRNPFEFDAATTLSINEILDFFIEDFNYTRFIQSQRNIFLAGERGSGKSMTLLFNSLPVQLLHYKISGETPGYRFVGIYVPCNTPLIHKKEYELIDKEYYASVISEHFLVLSVVFEISQSLNLIEGLGDKLDKQGAREELEYTVGIQLQEGKCFFDALKSYSEKELSHAQETINSTIFDSFYSGAFTFSSLIIPLLKILRSVDELSNTHFMLMFDDAHDLNVHQNALLNSLIAYRDRGIFSVKVALADYDKHDFKTHSGSTILEGHDFISIDMEKPFQRSSSPFGMFAKKIIEKRLRKFGIEKTAEEFFPINKGFEKDLEKVNKEVRIEAVQKFGKKEAKKINDYVYKYTRANYFRHRADTANLPPYSGWDTITHISTGVVRNLLEPCYWMYDQVISEEHFVENTKPKIEIIPPDIQRQVILDRSQKLWDWMERGLSRYVDNCSSLQGKQIYSLFDNLAILFRTRLRNHESEPRAIVFSISSRTPEIEEELAQLIDIAHRARLLYLRTGPAKDEGRREVYYVPNRILWPIRGLDVVGQHARVSLKAMDILSAAKGVPFPYVKNTKEGNPSQGEFDV